MPVKIYISGISGNKEVKKRQQRVMMILDSKNVQYEVIDITEPGREDDKEFMQSNSTARDNKHPLPPQIFNDEDYCGDYEDFDLSNEIDELDKFLKIVLSTDATLNSSVQSNNVPHNGNASSREASTDKDASAVQSESELDERTNLKTGGEDEEGEEKPEETETDIPTRETPDELDSEQADESTNRNEEKSDDQEQEE